MRREAARLWAAAALSARDRLRQRADLAGTSLLLVLMLFIFSRLWIAVEGEGADLGDWSAAQLVWYLLLTELVVLSPGGPGMRIARDVRTGDVSLALLRPARYGAWELALASGSALVRAGVLVLVGVPVAFVLVGPPDVSVAGVLFGLVALPAAIVLTCSMHVVIGLCAFWLEEVRPAYWIWQKASFLLGGLFLPLDLYPAWLRHAAELLPFQALMFAPARAVLAFDAAHAGGAVLGLVAWTVLLLGLMELVSARGLRRLTANGG